MPFSVGFGKRSARLRRNSNCCRKPAGLEKIKIKKKRKKKILPLDETAIANDKQNKLWRKRKNSGISFGSFAPSPRGY